MTDPNPIYTALLAEHEAAEAAVDRDGDGEQQPPREEPQSQP